MCFNRIAVLRVALVAITWVAAMAKRDLKLPGNHPRNHLYTSKHLDELFEGAVPPGIPSSDDALEVLAPAEPLTTIQASATASLLDAHAANDVTISRGVRKRSSKTRHTSSEASSALWRSVGNLSSLRDAFAIHTLQGVIFFAIFWAWVMLVICLCPWTTEFKQQHADRVLSIVHGFVASTFGICVLVFQKPVCVLPDSGEHWIRIAILNSAGYFLTDFFSMIVCDVIMKWRPVYPASFLHHICVGGIMVWVAENNFALWYAAFLLVNELSIGPMALVHIMRTNGYKQHPLFKFIGIYFVIIFFLCRIVAIPIGGFLLWRANFCNEILGVMTFVPIVSYVGLYALNWYWFVSIVKGALKALEAYDKPPSELDKPEPEVETLDAPLSRGSRGF